MSRSRGSRQEGKMPPTGAGLMRFFDEEARGIKLSPQIVIASCIVIAFLISLLHLFKPAG
jgi:preprotein translocase subunit Sec61beta